MEQYNNRHQQQYSYEDVYRKLMTAQDLQSLNKFKTHRSAQLLYPDAISYPDFFNHNLLMPGRVIKSVKGKLALIRAFNYQLMKLTFEIEVNDIDYVDVLKAVVFHPNLLVQEGDMTSPISGRTHTDRQYKRIIADFIELMEIQSIPNTQFLLMEYPVVDEAFSYVIETLISKCYTVEFVTNTLLNWLGETFSLTVERHGKCYKFQESDIFLYEESEDQYYLAFLNEMAQVSDYSESTRFDRMNSRLQGSSSPNAVEQQDNIDEDMEFKMATDKYRNSAQISTQRRQETEEQGDEKEKGGKLTKQNMRKTFSNEFMRQFVKEVDESIEKDKTDRSKIGSLLDIMSDSRSGKEKTPPQISSSRHFEEDEKSKPLTTRTAELEPLIRKSLEDPKKSFDDYKKSFDEPTIKPIYVEDESSTPHFDTQQHHNPFSKKYSQKYMKNFYAKNDYYGYEPTQNVESKYGMGESSFKASYDIKTYEDTPFLERNTSQFSFGRGNDSIGLSDSLDHLQIKKEDKEKNEFAYQYNVPSQQSIQPTYQHETYTSAMHKPWEVQKPWEISKPWESYQNKAKPNYEYSELSTPIDELKYLKSENSSLLYQPKPEDDDLIYRPSVKVRPPKETETATFDDRISDDTRGTIYREFTDSKVLAVMTSFERMKTNTIRQKYRGMHKRDLYRRG